MNGMPETHDALIQEVRIAVYGAIEATGNAPSAADLARDRRLEPAAVMAFQHLFSALFI